MRIGQLARKLNVTPTQIIQYLEELGVDTDKGVNTKLVKGGVDKVMDKFGDKFFESTVSEETVEVIEESTPVVEVVLEEDPEPLAAVDVVESEVPAEEPSAEAEPEPEPEAEVEEEIEVIKPNLVKLEGLKVMGKIDLPEPKIKEEKVKEEDDLESVQSGERGRRKEIDRGNRSRKSNRDRKARVPLSFEEKQKREELRLKRQRERDERERKKKKRKAYDERIKQTPQKAPKKLVQEKDTEVPEPVKQPERTKKPKSAWGKFKRWLNT